MALKLVKGKGDKKELGKEKDYLKESLHESEKILMADKVLSRELQSVTQSAIDFCRVDNKIVMNRAFAVCIKFNYIILQTLVQMISGKKDTGIGSLVTRLIRVMFNDALRPLHSAGLLKAEVNKDD